MKAVLAALLILPAIAVAQIPAADGTYTGCYLKATGLLRVINARQICLPGEVRITWNQKGQPGVPGGSGSGLVWKDAAGNVIAPYIASTPYLSGGLGAIGYYIDAGGIIWSLVAVSGDQQRQEYRLEYVQYFNGMLAYSAVNCSGAEYVQGSNFMFPRFVMSAGRPNDYVTLRDSAAPFQTSVYSFRDLVGVCRNLSPESAPVWTVINSSDLVPVTKPALPPIQGLLHLEPR